MRKVKPPRRIMKREKIPSLLICELCASRQLQYPFTHQPSPMRVPRTIDCRAVLKARFTLRDDRGSSAAPRVLFLLPLIYMSFHETLFRRRKMKRRPHIHPCPVPLLAMRSEASTRTRGDDIPSVLVGYSHAARRWDYPTATAKGDLWYTLQGKRKEVEPLAVYFLRSLLDDVLNLRDRVCSFLSLSASLVARSSACARSSSFCRTTSSWLGGSLSF